MASVDRVSIQDRLFPALDCFGCGPANTDGLHLQSYAEESGLVVARFRPWPQHANGTGFLNGGIIATLLDCHSAAAVMTEADRQGWHADEGAGLPFVTAGIDVRYRRPAPLHDEVSLTASIVEASPEQVVAEVWLFGPDSAEQPKAEAIATWRRWRSRRPSTATH